MASGYTLTTTLNIPAPTSALSGIAENKRVVVGSGRSQLQYPISC